MEKMTQGQTMKLIEWLKNSGCTCQQIIDCLEYMNK